MNMANSQVQKRKSKPAQKPFIVIAGPCAIENKAQMESILSLLKEEHILFLRGGLYKMRTNPTSFQGLREEGIALIQDLKKKYAFQFVSEVTDPRQIEPLSEVVDVFQVGARNMYNYELLKELGFLQKKTVLLKRAFSALVQEWLLAGEYVTRNGNENLIFCERGVRTFETATRNTLDLSGALVAKKESGFPVIVDPSHGTGRADLVSGMALAGAGAGLDGLLIEVHPEPHRALSDGQQSLDFSQFKLLMKNLRVLLSALKRPIKIS